MKHRCQIRQVKAYYDESILGHYWRVKCVSCPFTSYPKLWNVAISKGNNHYRSYIGI